jgi:hypothetical protein
VQVAVTPPPWVSAPVSIVARIAAESNPARARLLVVAPERWRTHP